MSPARIHRFFSSHAYIRHTFAVFCLDEANTVRHVKRVLVRSEADERLLLAIGTDERVDLGRINVVDLLKRLLDLVLVRPAVDNEHKGVDVLDLLHRTLSVEREEKGVVRLEARRVRGALTRVFRVARKTEGLGAVERHRGADLAHTLLAGVTLLDNLLRNVGLASRQVWLASLCAACTYSSWPSFLVMRECKQVVGQTCKALLMSRVSRVFCQFYDDDPPHAYMRTTHPLAAASAGSGALGLCVSGIHASAVVQSVPTGPRTALGCS